MKKLAYWWIYALALGFLQGFIMTGWWFFPIAGTVFVILTILGIHRLKKISRWLIYTFLVIHVLPLTMQMGGLLEPTLERVLFAFIGLAVYVLYDI